ncbi:MAG: hypothetical protein IKK43_00065 [Clostridia bacterium]|nr:hypothetical protein [Clostridia bacterium]
MLVFITFLVATVFLIIVNFNEMKKIKEEACDEKYDNKIATLPDNKQVCSELQKMINKECEIQLDDNTRSSAYIFFLDKIILSNNEMSKKSFSRILFIAHECIHSIQSRKMHIANFTLKNILNIFTFVLFIVLFLNKISVELLLTYFLVAFISFCINMILETDAIYRSLILARKYLSKYDSNEIADRYEEMVPKTIKGIYFRYASFSIYVVFIMSISLII